MEEDVLEDDVLVYSEDVYQELSLVLDDVEYEPQSGSHRKTQGRVG